MPKYNQPIPKLSAKLITRTSRLSLILVLTTLTGVVLFSASSAHKKSDTQAGTYSNAVTVDSGDAVDRILNKRLVAAPGSPSFLLPQNPPNPETIATFAADCTTPKTSFNFGDQVCAKLSGGPALSIVPRKITWVDTSNNLL